MVLDSSAILAIIFGESDAAAYAKTVASDPTRWVAAPTLLETSIVCLKKLGEVGLNELDLFCFKAKIEVLSFDEKMLLIAQKAFCQYGKGIHPANLNFGDCFSYALSKHSREPLLFKGEDFSKTDVAVAELILA